MWRVCFEHDTAGYPRLVYRGPWRWVVGVVQCVNRWLVCAWVGHCRLCTSLTAGRCGHCEDRWT